MGLKKTDTCSISRQSRDLMGFSLSFLGRGGAWLTQAGCRGSDGVDELGQEGSCCSLKVSSGQEAGVKLAFHAVDTPQQEAGEEEWERRQGKSRADSESLI